MFRKIDHFRTADAVIEQIEELILSGILRPGDRLPAERDLARETGVSRPILRDALKNLEMRDLLISRQGGGTFVADVIGPVFSEPVIALIERHPKAAEDYMEFRQDMETLAAHHAAARATPADHHILNTLIQAMDKAFEEDRRDDEARLDIEFHQAVGEAAHNMILLHSLRSCYRLLENGILVNRSRLFDHPTARAVILEQHKTIAARIIGGDSDGAAAASSDHIAFVRKSIKDCAAQAARNECANTRLHHRENNSQSFTSGPLRKKSALI